MGSHCRKEAAPKPGRLLARLALLSVVLATTWAAAGHQSEARSLLQSNTALAADSVGGSELSTLPAATTTSGPTTTSIVAGSTAAPASSAIPTTPVVATEYSYPIGLPGRPLGDGFFLRHGYTVENTWYNPRHWHTGEDWYALRGDTAGAGVYAVADGKVVYAGANYPGRVVIVEHAGGIFSMYGHLDPVLRVRVGDQVARRGPIGTVLRRADKVPNHLHFEIRTFLLNREVNGAAPRYPFRCGKNCPPGPGYWPIRAPELPSAMGWRNPTLAIARASAGSTEVVVASQPPTATITLWSMIGKDSVPQQAVGELRLQPGDRFPLLAVHAGPADSSISSAEGYQLWYKIGLPDGRQAWAQAAVPSRFETGRDGKPSTVYFNFYPAVIPPAAN